MTSPPPTTTRRRAGARQARRVALRRSRRRRLLAIALALILGGAGAVVLVVSGIELPRRSAGPAPLADDEPTRPGAPSADGSLLLVGHPPGGGAATSITLVASGPNGAAVLFVPVGVLADVPGHGTDLLASAQRYGGGRLVEATVENLLSIDIGAVATFSDTGLAALLSRAGGLELDVPARLVERDAAGVPSVRFEEGRQFLNGTRLAEYWSLDASRDELSAFARRRLVIESLLVLLHEDDAALDRVLADSAPELSTEASVDELRALLEGLAGAHAADRLTTTLLPVEPFGGAGPGGEPTYRVREQAAAELAAGLLGGAPDARVVRVQVLNGVGAPGVGQEVDRRLEGSGFRIVLTDNARSFDFAQTRILVYDESRESLEAAHRVRDLLGVGSISVSRQPQSVVDLTIVVGADFLTDDDHRE